MGKPVLRGCWRESRNDCRSCLLAGEKCERTFGLRERHCEPTGRANARPDDRLGEAIQIRIQRPVDCFVASAFGITRHSPRNGFNGFLRALPGDRAFLPPSPPKKLASQELDASVGGAALAASPRPIMRALSGIAKANRDSPGLDVTCDFARLS